MQLFKIDICALLDLVREDLHIEEDLDTLDQCLPIFDIESFLKLRQSLSLQICLNIGQKLKFGGNLRYICRQFALLLN